MISILITLLILGAVIYAFNLIIGMLTLPPQVKTIAYLILGVVALIVMLNLFLPGEYNKLWLR